MRANHYLSLAILLSLTLGSSAVAQSGIRWMNNLHEAQQVAQRDGRLILIHFYTNWCGPCRKLEHDVFPRTDVATAMMKNYVPVLVDAERFRDVAAHYKVDRFPMDIITDASGRVVFRTATPQDPIRYIQLLNGVASDHRFAPPGYAVSPPGTGEDPRFNGNHSQNTPPRNQTQQHQVSQSMAPPATQQPYGYGQGRSLPPGPAPYEAGRGYENGAASNQPARQSEYGPRYSGQAPLATQPPAPTYAPPQSPRETYNPHVASPNGLSRNGTTPQAPYYQQQGNPPAGGDYARTYQSPTPSRTSGWQTGPSQYAERGTQPLNANADQRFANPGPSMTDGRDRFASTPVAPRRQESPLALDGFCPVTLAEDETWQQGDSQWGAVHRGRTYLFTIQRYQRMFLADPDRYSPMLSGYDPVRYIERGETVAGLRQHGMWFGGKMYLFADEPSLDRFYSSPEYFAQKSHDIMMSSGR